MSSTLTVFVHGEPEKIVRGEADEIVQREAEEISHGETAILSKDAQTENEMPLVSRSLPISAIPNAINTIHHENFFQSGVNPAAILPSGNFHGCSFTFNVNVHNKN